MAMNSWNRWARANELAFSLPVSVVASVINTPPELNDQWWAQCTGDDCDTYGSIAHMYHTSTPSGLFRRKGGRIYGSSVEQSMNKEKTLNQWRFCRQLKSSVSAAVNCSPMKANWVPIWCCRSCRGRQCTPVPTVHTRFGLIYLVRRLCLLIPGHVGRIYGGGSVSEYLSSIEVVRVVIGLHKLRWDGWDELGICTNWDYSSTSN